MFKQKPCVMHSYTIKAKTENYTYYECTKCGNRSHMHEKQNPLICDYKWVRGCTDKVDESQYLDNPS